MEVTEQLLERIAKTARLSLTSEEKKKFLREFKEILNAFSTLNEISTADVVPSFQPVPIPPHLRDDTPSASISQEQALSLTAHKKDGYFKGPRVV